MPSGTGATKSGCKVTTIFANHQTFSRFFCISNGKVIQNESHLGLIVCLALEILTPRDPRN